MLAARLAADGALPHVFGLRGDRQVYRASILVLTVLAGALLLVAGGAVTVLVPLFAIGVFVGFALCQAGMLRRWWLERGPRWQQRASLNLLGTVLTGAAAVVLAAEKFVDGAWLIVLVIPLLVVLFTGVRRAYARIGQVLEIDACPPRPRTGASVVVVPVVGISRLTEEMVSAALSMGDRVVALHVVMGDEADDRGGAVVARHAGRHSTAVVCRLRFRLLPRPTRTPGAPRRPRGLVLPRSG